MTDDRSEPVPPEVLAAFGFEGASSRQFEQGLVNRHWLASRNAERLVFRRYNPNRTAAAARWEQELVGRAGAGGWPVARPALTTSGETLFHHDDRLWAAAPFLEGESDRSESPARYHIRGRLLARLHHDLESFPVEGQRPDFGKTWELDAWVAPANVGSFNELLGAFAREHPELAGLIRRTRYRNLRELSRLKYPDLPDRPIHGDFKDLNLLWRDGRLSGLLDFDVCRRDALLCDIADELLPFMPLDLKLAAAFFEGYESVRPLSDAEWEILTPLVRAAVLWWIAHCLVGWRKHDGPLLPIVRTMTVRLPAFEQAEAAYRALRKR